MRRLGIQIGVVAVVVAFGVSACTGKTHAMDAGGDASVAPKDAGGDAFHAVDCMQGQQRQSFSWYSENQLPSGACSDEGADCKDIGIAYACRDGNGPCPLNDDRCRCEGGQWHCWVEFAGACACGDDAVDAAAGE